jgi:hypothetical protein
LIHIPSSFRSIRNRAIDGAPAALTALLMITAACRAAAAAPLDRGYIERLGEYSGMRSRCGPFEVYHGRGSSELADEIERVVCRSFVEIASGVGLESVSSFAVVIADDTGAFRRLHAGGVPEWGEAFGDSRRMIIGIDASRVILSGRSIETVVRHELSHLLFYQRTAGAPAPSWFVEGIAMMQSREWTLSDQWRMALLVWREGSPRLDELEGRFPRSPQRAATAYLESYAAVQELIAGREEALVTLTAFLRDTGDFDRAFLLTFGETPGEYSERFAATMADRYRKTAILLHVSPYGLTMSALLLITYYIKRRRSRRKLEMWQREEGGPTIE